MAALPPALRRAVNPRSARPGRRADRLPADRAQPLQPPQRPGDRGQLRRRLHRRPPGLLGTEPVRQSPRRVPADASGHPEHGHRLAAGSLAGQGLAAGGLLDAGGHGVIVDRARLVRPAPWPARPPSRRSGRPGHRRRARPSARRPGAPATAAAPAAPSRLCDTWSSTSGADARALAAAGPERRTVGRSWRHFRLPGISSETVARMRALCAPLGSRPREGSPPPTVATRSDGRCDVGALLCAITRAARALRCAPLCASLGGGFERMPSLVPLGSHAPDAADGSALAVSGAQRVRGDPGRVRPGVSWRASRLPASRRQRVGQQGADHWGQGQPPGALRRGGEPDHGGRRGRPVLDNPGGGPRHVDGGGGPRRGDADGRGCGRVVVTTVTASTHGGGRAVTPLRERRAVVQKRARREMSDARWRGRWRDHSRRPARPGCTTLTARPFARATRRASAAGSPRKPPTGGRRTGAARRPSRHRRSPRPRQSAARQSRAGRAAVPTPPTMPGSAVIPWRGCAAAAARAGLVRVGVRPGDRQSARTFGRSGHATANLPRSRMAVASRSNAQSRL